MFTLIVFIIPYKLFTSCVGILNKGMQTIKLLHASCDETMSRGLYKIRMQIFFTDKKLNHLQKLLITTVDTNVLQTVAIYKCLSNSNKLEFWPIIEFPPPHLSCYYSVFVLTQYLLLFWFVQQDEMLRIHMLRIL